MTEEQEKNAKQYLKTAASYIGTGNKHKNSAEYAKTEKKAEKYKELAKVYYAKAKEIIGTTKTMQNMMYDEKEVYDILKKAVKERKNGDDDAIKNAVKEIIKAEKNSL